MGGKLTTLKGNLCAAVPLDHATSDRLFKHNDPTT
jgi:hypothetical protein